MSRYEIEFAGSPASLRKKGVSAGRRQLLIGAVASSAAVLAATLTVRAGAAPAAAEAPLLDPLRRASPLRANPERAMLTAITRAGQRLVAAGEAGIVIVSDDHGKSWRQARVPVSVTLTSLSFVTPRDGWAVGHGGTVLHTTDGGMSWAKQLDGRQAAQLAVDEARAARPAVDSGVNWKVARERLSTAERWLADGPDKPWLDVHFFNARDGIVVGAYGMALLTRDGGVHWQSIAGFVKNPGGRHLYKILVDRDTVFLVGEQGLILRGDVSLTQPAFDAVKSPYVGTFFDALAMGDGRIVLLGLRGHGFESADSGQTWKPLALKGDSTLTSGLWLPSPGAPGVGAGRLVIVDEGGQVRSSVDGAKTFNVLSNPERYALASVVDTADGALVVAGARGVVRLGLPDARGTRTASLPASVEQEIHS
ncbi:WD40/YVTN/BNR-like repeat-containing protein [Cupriavidus necator]